MNEVVAPILKMVYCVFIALSTNTGSSNHFSRMFDKDNVHMQEVRHDVFMFEVDLMCPECKAEGIDPSKCRHKDWMNPDWNSAANLARCKAFIPDEKMFAREVQGTMTADDNCLFGEASMTALRERARPETRVRLTQEDCISNKMTVFTMIDPNGGSKKKASECGIVSIVRLKDVDTIIVVGMASRPTVLSSHVEDFIKTYFRNFRDQMKHLAKVPHVLLIERNYGGVPVADLYKRYAMEIIPTIEEYHVEDRMEVAGVWTTEQLKHQSVTNMAWALSRNKVHLATRMCTDIVANLDQTIKKGIDQLGTTRMVSVGDKFKITGKVGNEPDDIGMTLILVAIWSVIILLRGFCNMIEIKEREFKRAVQDEENVRLGFSDLAETHGHEQYEDMSALNAVLVN